MQVLAFIYSLFVKFFECLWGCPWEEKPLDAEDGSIEKVDKHGNRFWMDRQQRLHRKEDLPAAEFKCGIRQWRVNGLPFRSDDGPTDVHADGSQLWLDVRGRPHRDSGPAFIRADGLTLSFRYGEFLEGYDPRTGHFSASDVKHKPDNSSRLDGEVVHVRDTLFWFDKNGLCHRDGGPAMIGIMERGNFEIWYQNGKHHRVGAPAKTASDVGYKSRFWGHKKWFQNGMLHREDGPAVVSVGGAEKWFLNGQLQKRRSVDGDV
ncbi:hypothetical protein [Micavibrio aeruginosavorus]|uniref:hypothetical protein n=1 Tax=Micavibrio aeruginosavorus TaxID=349221 RepID=UPI003F4ABA5C